MYRNQKEPLFFLAILPPENIREEVKTIKEQIKKEHNVEHALKLPAHITIQIPFRASEDEETILFKKLAAFSAKIKTFEVEFDGFGKFGKKVIFINIKNHAPFFPLHAELQHMINSFIDLKSHETSSKIHPHLTIAVRDLKRSNFPCIWKDFENKPYKNSFIAKDLVLLKHNGNTWDLLKKFPFGGI